VECRDLRVQPGDSGHCPKTSENDQLIFNPAAGVVTNLKNIHFKTNYFEIIASRLFFYVVKSLQPMNDSG
jgi:hypothetical protein